jgi:hypothetical protein
MATRSQQIPNRQRWEGRKYRGALRPAGARSSAILDLVSHPLLSTTPTAEKPALNEAQRLERLRLLSKRLRNSEGLDRDALKHIEQLTGDER